MFVVAGRFLAALVLAGVAVVVGQLPAHACSCAPASTQDHVKAADGVFTGTVSDQRTEQSETGRGGTTTYLVDVRRVYKGDVSTRQVSVTSPRSEATCGLGRLAADKRYVFFVRAGGSQLSATACGGTAPAGGELLDAVVRSLGQGHVPVSAPEPEQAVFTRVAQSRPASVTRLAAPGGALVLVGLLGLVVVRRLARRG